MVKLQTTRLLIYFLFMVSISGPVTAESPTPQAMIDDFHAALLLAMKEGKDFDHRYQLLQPVITRNFDVSTIVRIVLGRNGKNMTDVSRMEIESLMGELIASTYANRFEGLSGDVFKVIEASELRNNRITVKSQLTTATGERVQLDYQLAKTQSDWLIYDVVSNGVSDLSLKRSLYARLYNEKGLGGVIEELKSSIEQNRP